MPLIAYIGKDNEDLERFTNFKKKKSAKSFCTFNKTQHFTEVLKECYEMKYDASPNYEKLKFLLNKIILDKNVLPGG